MRIDGFDDRADYTGTSRLYMDSDRFRLNPLEQIKKHLENNLDLFMFFKVFQTQALLFFSRRPSGFDPDSLQLKGPTFDRFRPTFLFVDV